MCVCAALDLIVDFERLRFVFKISAIKQNKRWSRAHFNHVNMINVIKKSSPDNDIKSGMNSLVTNSPQQGGRIPFYDYPHDSILMTIASYSLDILSRAAFS